MKKTDKMFDPRKVSLTKRQAVWLLTAYSKGTGISNKDLLRSIPAMYPFEKEKNL